MNLNIYIYFFLGLGEHYKDWPAIGIFQSVSKTAEFTDRSSTGTETSERRSCSDNTWWQRLREQLFFGTGDCQKNSVQC